jgi:hypothetical protein
VFPGEFRPTDTDATTSASTNTSPTAAVPFTYTGKGIEKDGRIYPIDWRQSYALSNNYSFAINQRMNVGMEIDFLLQEGLLSSPFNRVYFDDGFSDENNKEVRVESLPRERMKLALSGRFNWFLNSLLILRTQARYYQDSWGIRTNTYVVEMPVKTTRFLSFTPFYRLHIQEGSTYYHAYGQHLYVPGSFYTSDIDLGEFTAHKFGLSLRYVHFPHQTSKHFSLLTLKDISLRYARYDRQDGLYANMVSFEINFDIKNK